MESISLRKTTNTAVPANVTVNFEGFSFSQTAYRVVLRPSPHKGLALRFDILELNVRHYLTMVPWYILASINEL